MKEETDMTNWIGVIIIILGCFLMGISAETSKAVSHVNANYKALLITQYAYSRGVNVSQLLPYYNVAYVTIPVLIQKFILPDYYLSIYEIFGIIIISAGIFVFSSKVLINSFRNI